MELKTQGLIPDKVLNILVYGAHFCVVVYTSYRLSETVHFLLDHPAWCGLTDRATLSAARRSVLTTTTVDRGERERVEMAPLSRR